MWDRLTNSAPSATTTTTTTPPPPPPARLQLHAPAPAPASGLVGLRKKPLSRTRGPYRSSPADWHDDRDGVASAPFKYEIRRGKVVPQVADSGIFLPSHQHNLPAAPVGETLSRDPRQPSLQQHRLPRDSSWRPVSSIYSQSDDSSSDSDDAPPTAQPNLVSGGAMYRLSTEAQVSPPSSPDVDVRDGQDVSPIEEEPDVPHDATLRGARRAPEAAAQQHVPTVRSHHRRPQDAPAPLGLRELRQDAKPSSRQVHLGQPPASGTGATGFGSTTVIAGPSPGRITNTAPRSFGQRMLLMARSRPESGVENRPPWKGASGRSKLLQPVRDDPDAAPLNHSAKSGKKTRRSGVISQPGSETSDAGSTTQKASPLTSYPEAGRNSQSRPAMQRGLAQQPYPSPPYSDSSAQSPPATTHSPWHSAALSPPPREALATSAKAIKRKPPLSINALSAPQAFAPLSSNPVQPPITGAGTATPNLAAESASPGQSSARPVQPPSHSAVTTNAASNPDTLRQPVQQAASPAPPLSAPDASVMQVWRRFSARHDDNAASHQPTAVSMSSPSHEANRETLSVPRSRDGASDERVAADGRTMERRASLLSLAKPLPPAPPEMSSSDDRVGQLRVELQSLAHRRINLGKSIEQMTKFMPTDSLFASDEVLRKREAEKMKVQALREELSEVQREEYDLGLKLHRAYKRLDRDAQYEPSCLWVRRATA